VFRAALTSRIQLRKREREIFLAGFGVFSDIQVDSLRIVQRTVAEYFVEGLCAKTPFSSASNCNFWVVMAARSADGESSTQFESAGAPSMSAAKSSGVLASAAAKSGKRTPNSDSSRA